MSKHSSTVDDFYATNPGAARWLADELRNFVDLDGKTALEPCVGSWVFPDTVPELSWKTNDINTWTDRKPDFSENFLEGSFEHVDVVLTNPPFGRNNSLAFAFVKKSCEVADTVAMIVPSFVGKWTKRLDNAVSREFKLVFTQKCPIQEFDLPDGTRRKVRTHGVIFQRVPGYERPKFKPAPTDTRETLVRLNKNGKFALRLYGDGVGDIRDADAVTGGNWTYFDTVGKQCAALKLMMTYPWRFQYGDCGANRAPWGTDAAKTPTLSWGGVLHHINCMAVLEGRQEPLEGIDYEEFLERFQELTFHGLTLP